MATIDKVIRSVIIKDESGNTVSTVPIGTEAELVIFDNSVGDSNDTSYTGQTLDPILETKLAEKANIEYYTNNGVSLGKKEDSTLGENSVAIGNEVTASGIYSQAFGNNTIASGSYSHAEGSDTQALGYDSHAEGKYTIAEGHYSHAEGYGGEARVNKALGTASHVEGYRTHAKGKYSHAEGFDTITNEEAAHAEGHKTQANGKMAHAEGQNTFANGNYSHSEGENSHAEGIQSHAEGYETLASGATAHAEGAKTQASGDNAHAEGAETEASGINAHAEGGKTIASGKGSHAEGYGWDINGVTTYVTASGEGSHAEGLATSAITTAAHAEGFATIASGHSSHTEGQYTNAEGVGSHAGGYSSKATKMFSFAHGYNVITSGDSQFVVGRYNVEDSNQIFIVGTGDADNRNNAFTVNSNGNSNANGTLYANGLRSYMDLTVDGGANIAGSLSAKGYNLTDPYYRYIGYRDGSYQIQGGPVYFENGVENEQNQCVITSSNVNYSKIGRLHALQGRIVIKPLRDLHWSEVLKIRVSGDLSWSLPETPVYHSGRGIQQSTANGPQFTAALLSRGQFTNTGNNYNIVIYIHSPATFAGTAPDFTWNTQYEFDLNFVWIA